MNLDLTTVNLLLQPEFLLSYQILKNQILENPFLMGKVLGNLFFQIDLSVLNFLNCRLQQKEQYQVELNLQNLLEQNLEVEEWYLLKQYNQTSE